MIEILSKHSDFSINSIMGYKLGILFLAVIVVFRLSKSSQLSLALITSVATLFFSYFLISDWMKISYVMFGWSVMYMNIFLSQVLYETLKGKYIMYQVEKLNLDLKNITDNKELYKCLGTLGFTYNEVTLLIEEKSRIDKYKFN